MPNPRRRRSPSLQGRQRAHKNLEAKCVSVCPNCQAARKPHSICPACGYYKDRSYEVKVTS